MRITLILCLLVTICSSTCFGADKPNIIFILADDLAQGDLGCYGQKLIKTPHLDRMAAEGTRYTQGYCGTSVCAPSRTSLMVGQHTGHSPIRGNRGSSPTAAGLGDGQLPLPESTVTVVQILKSAGYATACMGKWGMGQFDTTGSPLKKGFDHFYGYNGQVHAHNYFPTFLCDDDKKVELSGNDEKGKSQGTYAQNLIQQDMITWVKKQKDKPFFLFYATTLPHGSYHIDDVGEYANREGWSELQKTYAAMVTRLDRSVGELMATLKEMGVDDNTVIMFAGDNGSSFAENTDVGKLFDQSMGETIRGFKRSMYEGGLRQAALARWPGKIPAGRVSDEPWAFWDFLPTAADLAGATIPATCKTDGHSLVSFLKGGPAPTRDYFYWELSDGKNSIQAVRFGHWKAVRNFSNVPTELYDLKTDSGEKNNVAAQHPDLVAKAEALMSSARTDNDDFPFKSLPKPDGKKK